jgi:hypothetical protein
MCQQTEMPLDQVLDRANRSGASQEIDTFGHGDDNPRPAFKAQGGKRDLAVGLPKGIESPQRIGLVAHDKSCHLPPHWLVRAHRRRFEGITAAQ